MRLTLISSCKFLLFILLSNLVISCSGDSSSDEIDDVNEPINIIKTQVLRSEFEASGDLIYDIVDTSEGSKTYTIKSGNSNNYYSLNNSTGEIKIQNPIPDLLNVVHEDILIIAIDNNAYEITILDAFDYYLTTVASNTVVLQNHNDKTIGTNTEWTALNNLWGKGDAAPNTDFRIATIHNPSLPNGAVLIWDVPSKASDYNGAAVWCYNNIFWGNRKNVREDLNNFPFQIQAIKALSLNFKFEQLFGNDQFKIAMNMFMTDESELTNFSKNDGDFFFVFDQKETFIPNYSHSLPDITIDNKKFAVRYDINTTTNYERRRVIIKDNKQYLSGSLDINALFNMFIEEDFLNPLQYIYHIQFGVEVTTGWGAVKFNELEINFTK